MSTIILIYLYNSPETRFRTSQQTQPPQDLHLAAIHALIHSAAMVLPFPIAVLDFEASSLEHDGYPIEVDVAILDGPDAGIRSWSTLIRPTGAWSVGGPRSKESQRIHGIACEELADGVSVREAMAGLNALLAPIGRAYYDGGDYDRAWLASLTKAAGMEPAFMLCDLETAFVADHATFERMISILKSTPAPHRAEPDATRLLCAVAGGVSAAP